MQNFGGIKQAMKMNLQNSPKISIVIPFYNEEKSIIHLLNSILNLSKEVSYELILVDNNSTDKTLEIINKYKKKLPTLKIVKEKKQGIGSARKKGFTKVKSEIIASTDADTVLPSDWLIKIYNNINDNRYVGTVGTYRFFDKSDIFNFSFRSAMIFFDYIHRIFNRGYAFRGLNFAITKKAYLKSRGFNPEISALEDVDLSLRVKEIGKIKYCPKLILETSYRRFQGRFFSQLVKRMKSYFYRVILKNDKESDWDIVR